MVRHFFLCTVASLVALAPACGSDESPIATTGVDDGSDAAAGGKSGSGGSRSGGATGLGGSKAGGAGGSSSGGVSGASGASAGGSNGGGADASAGGSNTGGANTDGGSDAGGATGSGGASNDGGPDGSSGTGGSNTGGSSGAGGSNTGGSSGAGGAGTGGAPTGGAPNDAGGSTVFVNPATGDNGNSGLSSSGAVKWISKAAEIAHGLPSPRTILLEDGSYDAAGVLVLGGSFPPDTTVRAVSSAGVTVHGSSGAPAFVFEDGGALRNVTLDTWANGVQVYGSGTFDMSNVHFVNVSSPMQFFDSVVATIDAGVTGTFAVPPSTGFGSVLFASGNTTVTFRNGMFQNIPGNGGQIFHATGDAKLTIDGTVIDTATVRAISIFDNADVVLMNSEIHRVSFTGNDEATIFMGGSGGLAPLGQSLDVLSTDITENQVAGLKMVLHSNFASKPNIKFTASHVDNNTGSGIVVTSNTSINSGVVNTVQLINSTFNGNTLAGITAPVGTFAITGGEFSGNGGAGLALTAATHVNSLRVRGTVKIDANEEHGISFDGAAGSTLDLGSGPSPAAITFTGVATNYSAVNLVAVIQGTAVGNTWMPNVQGASGSGVFTTPTTITGPVSGLNATVVSGGSLVVAE